MPEKRVGEKRMTRCLLSDIEDSMDRWDRDSAAPVQSALDRRSQIRRRIAQLRR